MRTTAQLASKDWSILKHLVHGRGATKLHGNPWLKEIHIELHIQATHRIEYESLLSEHQLTAVDSEPSNKPVNGF